VSSTEAPANAPPGNKMLITIRHLPTEKENKFRVKGSHTVGRVLTSACAAFELNPDGYVYLPCLVLRVLLPPLYELTVYSYRYASATLVLWTEEDGLEMSYPCGNDWSMNSLAEDGCTFNIELAK
jgi:hypothetical protein